MILVMANNSTTTDWEQEDTEAASGGGATQHLWEESWDDDDTSDDFSAQLKYVTLSHPRVGCVDSKGGMGGWAMSGSHADKYCREELKKVEASKKR